MRGNRSADTGPEKALRAALHAKGLRFRKNFTVESDTRKLKPDIVFTRKRVAVFMDGCFWHGCAEHGRVPGGKNAEYWKNKIALNRSRDVEDFVALTRSGWLVLRIWEHTPVGIAVQKIQEALGY